MHLKIKFMMHFVPIAGIYIIICKFEVISMYKCKICQLDLETVRCYVDHCRLHSNLPKLRLPCCYEKCNKTVTSYIGLRQHIKRDHGKSCALRKKSYFQAVGLQLRCTVASCSTVCSDTPSLTKHLQVHIKEGIKIQCPMVSCHKMYSVRSSFLCHLLRNHRNWSVRDLKACVTSQNSLYPDQQPQSDNPINAYDDDDVNVNESEGNNGDVFACTTLCSLDLLRKSFEKNLSMFFLRLGTYNLIPESTVEVIGKELSNINAINQQYFYQILSNALNEVQLKAEDIDRVLESLNQCDLIKSCLGEGGLLHSTRKRTAYVRNNCNFVEPESVYVGVDSRNKCRYCYYVPIKKSLQVLLRDRSIFNQCMNSCQGERLGNSISDFTDGSVYKNLVGKDSTKSYLSLILYQDSFEVANPLGSAKRKHKILGFYFTLGNLETHNRSEVHHIQLAMLALEGDVNKAGQKIFRRLVDDLRNLEEEGIEIDGKRFHVIVPAFVGDNLGSHWIGGFVTNFSTTQHMCRFCTMTKDQFSKGQLCATAKQIRTVASYQACIDKLAEENVTLYEGIKFNSIFNQLKTFHVCNPGLPPCIAHDLFEGVVAYDMALFIRYFVSGYRGEQNTVARRLTLKLLNKRLQCFRLTGSDALVKPPQIHSSHERLSGTAAQNWCLLRIFPLLIEDIIDVMDDVYQCMLLLRNITEFIMAPRISVGQICEMKFLIEDYLDRRSKLFCSVKLRPKHHFMTHYAELTLQFGPLVRLWTMRFESKHQYFKRCVRHSKNFINVAYMLANRHQLLQAYLSESPRFDSNFSSQTVLSIDSSLSADITKLLHLSGILWNQVFSEVNFKGTVYCKGFLLPLEVNHSKKEIQFGEIVLIIYNGECIEVLVNILYSKYNFDIGCYILLDREKTELKILPLPSFADFYPLNIYKINGCSAIPLKHQLCDLD